MLQDSSVIIRIKRFLSSIPPFIFFSEEDLIALSTYCNVGVYKSNTLIFKQGDVPKKMFFIVKKGAVDIVNSSEGIDILHDKCGEEDMFGIRPLLAESSYLFSATATEDTILYEVPVHLFKEMYKQYDQAVDYMIQRFAAGQSIRDTMDESSTPFTSIISSIVPLKIDLKRELVSTTIRATVGEAVKIMHRAGVSSIIITNDDQHPIGILTDRDLRKLMATQYNADTSINDVMSKPVMTISPHLLLQEIQLTMINSGFHHLCVTEDGSPESKAIGMVTEHDVLYASATDPVVILKKIKAAKNIAALKEARNKIDTVVPTFISDTLNPKITLSLIDKLNRSLIQKVVHLSLLAFNETNEPIGSDSFSFYNMGSAARGEQLLMTDQDNGIIFDDECVHRKQDYLKLGRTINDHLHAIGYEYCPADMMASRESWCRSLTEMKQITEKWMISPGPEEVLMTSIFFDARHEFGNEDLFRQLQFFVTSVMEKQDVYIRFLAKQAVASPPPLSFFRQFIIEKDGAHKDRFDIKLRGLASLSDCARILALAEGYMQSSNTLDRYQKLKEVDQANAILYEDACESYIDLLKFRLQFALKNRDSGRYITISDLDKIQKINLRRAFHPMRDIQSMIERKYHLSYL